MGRHAHRDRRQPGGYLGRHTRPLGQDQGQRAGPETLGQLLRQRARQRHLVHEPGVCHVNDQRVIERPLLGLENSPHGVWVQGMCAQPVDGFGRKGHKSAGA